MQSDASADPLPRQSQMLFPILEEIAAGGGIAAPGEIYDRLAARFDIAKAVRDVTVRIGDRDVNAYERRVRWARQTLVARGLIAPERRGVWELTSKARTALREVVRGVVVTVFETSTGFALWANAEDALACVERESVDLLITSPPYPLLRSRAYSNYPEREWVEWMTRLCAGWQPLMRPTGSLMLNLGPCWMPGVPQQSLYVERLLIRLEELGLHLLQRLDWASPNKLPSPMPYVAVQRIRVKPSVEAFLWLAGDPARAKADNRRVLQPYSESGKRAIASGKKTTTKRPSGFVFGPSSFEDRGGAIPPSLIVATNCASSSRYHRAVRQNGTTAHPATAPEALFSFGIKLATEEEDLVYDPFFGSGVTGVVAERLKRRWIGSERSLTYLENARLRFESELIPTRRTA